jgi:hypothetical protein
METLLGLALVAGIVFLVMRLTRAGGLRRPHKFKCHDCRYLRRTFDDGVMCGYGSSEVFKNPRHIAMCPDWAERIGR